MSVRTILFALLAIVFLGLIGTQWWMTRQQHEALAQALSTTAFTVSRDTVSALIFEQTDESALLHDQSFEMRLDSNATQGSIVLISPQFQHRIDIPKTSMQKTLAASQKKQLMLALLMSLLGVLAALIIAYRFARPLRQLQMAAQQVANGQFGQQLPLPALAPRELAQSIQAFNQMSRDLQQLERDNQRLRAQQQVDELSDLARGLAHTMRNPLNTLGLSLDELTRPDLDDGVREQLAAIARRQIASIDSRLRALLDVSALNEPNQNILLSTVVNDVIAEFTGYTFALDGDLDAAVSGQPREVNMIVHTLISNACEATQTDKRIEITLKQLSDHVAISIRDFGSGITPEIKERLFQPHVSSKQHGAGLGLYLAKRVVSGRYHGDIVFNDNPPQGTLVTVLLHDRRA